MRSRYRLRRALLTAVLAAAASPLRANTYSDPMWIVRPANDAVIRNQTGNINVAVGLAQPLDVAAGDYVQLVLDGKVVAASSDSQRFKLPDLPLGRHTLEADLRDSHDRVLLRSAPVMVDMTKPRG
jgi:hypothetical protein